MKKMFIIAAALLVSSAALAQTASIKNAQAVQKKIEKSDATLADAKKAASSNAWLERATVLIDAANAYTHKLFPGLPVAQMELPSELGKPNSIEEVQVTGVGTMSKYVYEQFDMYVSEDGLIQFWETTKPLYPSELNEALKSLEKAKELNAKDFSKSGRGATIVERFVKESAVNGVGLYSLGKYVQAGAMLKNAFTANTLVGTIDTTMLYNAGLCYFGGGEYEEAIRDFEQLLSYGANKDGLVLKQIGDCYIKLNQNDKAIENYEKAFKINPSNLDIMGGLIDGYIAAEKNPELVIELLKSAQLLAPENAVLYHVEGDVWNKIGNRENAIKAIETALTIEPNNFVSLFYAGYWTTLESNDVNEKADKLDINARETYDAMKEQVKQLRLKAIEYYEKAYAVDPTSEDVIANLRSIYFVCRDYTPEISAKYEKLNAEHPQK